MLWDGHLAVMVFFVLSGYVLARPFLRPTGRPSAAGFVVRRWFRIWPPYAAAMVLAICLQGLTAAPTPAPGLSTWFNWQFHVHLSMSGWLSQFALVAFQQSFGVDSAVWSLVHEMRISIVFPLLILAVIRWDNRLLAAIGLGLQVIGFAVTAAAPAIDAGDTIGYSALFILGAAIAKSELAIGRWWSSAPRGGRLVLVAAGCAAAIADATISNAANLPAAAAAGIALAVVVASPAAGRWLRARPLLFLGRISYSLYLVHVPILLASLHVASGRLPAWLGEALALAISVAVATMLYHLVERPSIIAGGLAAARLQSLLAVRRTKTEVISAAAGS